jgi:hypothetical protein
MECTKEINVLGEGGSFAICWVVAWMAYAKAKTGHFEKVTYDIEEKQMCPLNK